MKFPKKVVLLFLMSYTLSGCLGVPDNIQPISGLDADRYLGTWYEIARLDHVFERGMDNVSAHYSLREDGGIKVLNKGYKTRQQKWKSIEGKAYFVEDEQTGHLKVSFFGPFYGSYVIYELDKEGYDYAFVSGPNLSYLWFLSRTPQVSDTLKEKFIAQASALGFNTDELIFVIHQDNL